MIILYGDVKKQLYDIFEHFDILYSTIMGDGVGVDLLKQLTRTKTRINKFKKMVERVEKEDEEERKIDDERRRKEAEFRSEQLNHPG